MNTNGEVGFQIHDEPRKGTGKNPKRGQASKSAHLS